MMTLTRTSSRRCATGCATRCRASRERRLAFGHGTANAYDEAAYLLLHALHLPLDRLEPFLDARLTHAEREAVLDSASTAASSERIPAAYLTHEAWLGRLPLLRRRARDHSALLHRRAAARRAAAPDSSEPAAVQTGASICAPGRAASPSCSRTHFPNADVDAADISSDALAVALRNVADHGLQATDQSDPLGPAVAT